MKWTAYVEQKDNDLILPLPNDLLDEMGWKEGDVLVWDIQDDGSVILRKKTSWVSRLFAKIKSWRNKK